MNRPIYLYKYEIVHVITRALCDDKAAAFQRNYE